MTTESPWTARQQMTTNPDTGLPIEPATDPAEPPRKRLSLNQTRARYRALAELAYWWGGAGITETIDRSVGIARRVFGAQHPDVYYSDRAPADRPMPGYWALHTPKPDGTETVIRLEMV